MFRFTCKFINISPSFGQLNAHPVLMCSKVTVTRLVVIALAVVCVTTLQAFAAASTATTAPSASTKPCWVNRPAASRLLTTNYNLIFINQYIKITCVWRVLLESARGDRSGSSRRCWCEGWWIHPPCPSHCWCMSAALLFVCVYTTTMLSHMKHKQCDLDMFGI